MTIVTITEAAKLAGVSRGTIYNKIDVGELSKGSEGIDIAELLRVFGELKDVSSDVKTVNPRDASDGSDGSNTSNGVTARQNDDLVRQLIDQLEQARVDKEHLREQAEEEKRERQEARRKLDDMQEKLNNVEARHAEERQGWKSSLDDMQQKLLAAPDEEQKAGFWAKVMGLA